MRVLWRRFVVRFVLLAVVGWFGSSLPVYSDPAHSGAVHPSPAQSHSESLPNQLKPDQLKSGESVQGAIAPGQSHVYAIDLAAGQYLHLEVEMERIDLILRLLSPEGGELEHRENLVQNASIPLSFVASASGTYRVEIRQPVPDGKAEVDKSSQIKTYTIKVDQLRNSDTDDQRRITAEHAESAGDKLRAE